MSIDAKPDEWNAVSSRYYDNRPFQKDVEPRCLLSDHREKVKDECCDPVNQPQHYRTGDIECIDAIKAALGSEGFIDYCHGNALKYLWRWRHKNGIEDVEKALVYLDWMIKEGRNGE